MLHPKSFLCTTTLINVEYEPHCINGYPTSTMEQNCQLIFMSLQDCHAPSGLNQLLCMPLNFCIFTQKNLYWKISYNQIFQSAHSITSMAIQCLAWIEYHWLIFVCRLGLTYLLLFCMYKCLKESMRMFCNQIF